MAMISGHGKIAAPMFCDNFSQLAWAVCLGFCRHFRPQRTLLNHLILGIYRRHVFPPIVFCAL